MKLSDYIILFFSIFIGIFLIITISINIDESESKGNRRYAAMLSSASESAVGALGYDTLQNGYIWRSEENKEKATRAFFKTLNLGFNSENKTKADEIAAYIPVLLMVDTDGYYITFNSAFDEHGNVSRPSADSVSIDSKAYTETMTTSPLFSWAKKYGGFKIRFYLNDSIDVITPTGKIYSGRKEIVKQDIEDDCRVDSGFRSQVNSDIYYDDLGRSYNLLRFIDNANNVYNDERNSVVVNSILEEVSYYVNNQNMLARGNNIPYIFEMPEISEEDWHRLLANPTLISFMQGYQTPNWTSFINIYALSGGEVIKQKQYFITEEGGEKHYHLLDTANRYHHIELRRIPEEIEVNYAGDTVKRTITREIYVYIHEDGTEEEITKIYTSMDQCALAGADACDCAINNN